MASVWHLSPLKDRTVHYCVGEVSLIEHGHAEVCSAQISTPQVGAGEVGGAEVCAAQL